MKDYYAATHKSDWTFTEDRSVIDVDTTMTTLITYVPRHYLDPEEEDCFDSSLIGQGSFCPRADINELSLVPYLHTISEGRNT